MVHRKRRYLDGVISGFPIGSKNLDLKALPLSEKEPFAFSVKPKSEELTFFLLNLFMFTAHFVWPVLLSCFLTIIPEAGFNKYGSCSWTMSQKTVFKELFYKLAQHVTVYYSTAKNTCLKTFPIFPIYTLLFRFWLSQNNGSTSTFL